ncbi:class II aldolase/adducin family protein [Natronospira bacteriovora]|uniref:Class II aldolase/adducin family protein n=1 Tax=Natronospira bacteriovora TaxID=3069753 RepID=A0ABU0W738_9GAMM|nr:class II aldolase/adducin family protein [Natronospira sp. AB-CW4]MDQ2069568.1 class II aldolase/adducin family protein [Natronospira sp. AB-CW4]
MSTQPVSDLAPPQALVLYYELLRRHGYNDSHSGNASVRDGDRIWVTPTGACADTLQADELIPCRPGETPPEGASLDAPLHLAVHAARDDIGAVLHSHGHHAVGLTMSGRDFLPPDFEGSFYFRRVPVLDVPYDRYVEEAPARVAATLAEHPICIVRGHGLYARGENLDRAYKWSCSLEQSARTAYVALQAGLIGLDDILAPKT